MKNKSIGIIIADPDDELREWPHPRSERAVKNLAEFRGSEVGLKAAEAFILVRDVKK